MKISFQNMSVLSKIFSISIISILFVLCLLFLYFLPNIEKRIMQEKYTATKHLVEVAVAHINDYYNKAKAGEMSEAAAQKAAALSLKPMLYGQNDYFWINDMLPRMVMHSMKSEMDGQDLRDYKDPNGKLLFVEMVKVCKEKGEGFVDYMWPKPGIAKPVPKISFVKAFNPWGWVIGTGIYVDDVKEQMNSLRNIIIGGALVLAGIMFVITLFIGVKITNPLKDLMSLLTNMIDEIEHGRGDLTKRVTVHGNDEVAKLGKSFNAFIQKLQEVIIEVAKASSQIAASAQELSSTSEEMAAGSEEQTSQTSQVATSVEEMSATIQQVAKSATTAAERAKESKETAAKGGVVVQQTIEGMNRIAQSVRDLQQIVQALSKNSEKIGDIVRVIDDVADQTNLLALNAAIEAARAGEQGRGFAVVADEVRKLAERTTASTKEIADMVKSIQADTSQAVSSMELSAKEVNEGVKLAEQAGIALKEIVANTQTSQEMVQQIATAAEQQSAAAEEISSNVESIASVSKQTAAGAQQTSSAAQELNVLADGLQQLVGKFKVGEISFSAQHTPIKKTQEVRKFEIPHAQAAHKTFTSQKTTEKQKPSMGNLQS